MLLIPNSSVTIGQFRLKGVHHIKIEKSIHEYADKAVIKLPASGVLKSPDRNTQSMLNALRFKVGDPVHIQLGYDGTLKDEFKGFVRQINPSIPCEIECEGYSWLLRSKKNIKASWSKTTLREVLEEVVKDTAIKLHPSIPDMELLNIAINDASGTQVIEHLKGLTKGALAAFFIDDVLYMGLAYMDLAKATAKYRLRWNTIDGDSLKYKRAEDVNVSVELNFRQEGGQQVTAKTGVPGGVVRKDTISAVANEQTLKDIAQAKLLQEAYNGYEGTIPTLLIPYVQPGYRAEIKDRFFPEREGNYFVESVETTFGDDGGKRSVEIGIKLS